jgi:hypothetical protein
MTSKIKHYQMKATLYILILLILILVQTLKVNAQTNPSSRKTFYRGFIANFGTRTFTLKSNIDKLDGATVGNSGGQLGLVAGGKVLRARLGLFGYYSSGQHVAGSVDMYETSLIVNFYPLELLSRSDSKLQPYLNAGLSYDRVKFFGHYLSKDPGTINYSTTRDPYLGKIKQITNSIGAGLAFKVIDNADFLHIFTEVRYLVDVSRSTNNEAFARTSIGNQLVGRVGISFGAR